MKLKHKLAKQYAKSLKAPYAEGSRELIAEDFIAGFEQARELARLECTRFDCGDDPAILDIDVRIGEMGEEEV